MNNQYLLGVDLGTRSTKAALYTTDGQLVVENSLEVPHYAKTWIALLIVKREWFLCLINHDR